MKFIKPEVGGNLEVGFHRVLGVRKSGERVPTEEEMSKVRKTVHKGVSSAFFWGASVDPQGLDIWEGEGVIVCGKIWVL